MKRIRINDFYQVIEEKPISDNEITNIKTNLTSLKKDYLEDEIKRTRVKYNLTKLVTVLVEVIDILVLLGILFLDIDIKSRLVIIVFGLNILVGIVLAVIPDFKLELEERKEEFKESF